VLVENRERKAQHLFISTLFIGTLQNMKYIIILGDGMADEPIEILGGKTPLQAAKKPTIDKLAELGRCGTLRTIPEGFPPGSEIANLSVLGYDVSKVFEGRGVLEAASMGVSIKEKEMAMRCNLICIEDGKIKNHSAGHISTEEATELIQFLNKELGSDSIRFYPGVSYRHLLVMKNGNKAIACTPPHDVPGTPFRDVLIRAEKEEAEETASQLNDLILRSQDLLKDHPVNQKRIAEGKDPANSIWLWSPGYRPRMETLLETYDLRNGAVISAVDLIKGIGIYAGLQSIDVEGATGLYDTNYEGKTKAAIEALKDNDFVFLHIEASDEAGHEGNAKLKVRTIEYLDDRVVKPIYEEISTWNEPVAIAILPDHPTLCRTRTHTADPVPFLIYRPGKEADKVKVFDEFSVKQGSYGELAGNQFMDALTDTNFIVASYRKMKQMFKEWSNNY
jgi:2,3-bisphosphoglycerate-independent phosphoglycerate mutase